uniref:Uncharacterized protein n=1 Tax=Anguilla anguilla TaxID=7936 RepID=A0A0E9PS10_ANGAN
MGNAHVPYSMFGKGTKLHFERIQETVKQTKRKGRQAQAFQRPTAFLQNVHLQPGPTTTLRLQKPALTQSHS